MTIKEHTTMSEYLETIESAAEAAQKADTAYANARDEFMAIEKAYFASRGFDTKTSLRGLLSQWGPKLATYVGLPGGAAMLSQPGVLGAITDALTKAIGG